MSEQAENLSRVSTRISAAIIEYVTERRQFVADDLRRFVNERIGTTAPGSADRILRYLRQQRKINYRVISRRKSLYEVLPVAQEASA